MTNTKIERTNLGWSVQLRIGAGRRRNYTIATHDRALAQARADVMAEMSHLLIASGCLVEAPESLGLLAQGVTTDEQFAGVVQGIRDFCSDATKPARVRRHVTFSDLAEQWTSGKLAKAHPDQVRVKKSVKDDKQRLAILCETIGDVPLVGFTLDDAERAMRALPATVQSASTRRQYAILIRHLLSLAIYPCRLITSSPIPKKFCPKPARQPDFVCLYPDEEVRLMGCVDIPLEVRALYGFVCREGTRLANVFDLTWDDVDLTRGLIRLHVTKTGTALEWNLDPSVARTLRALRALHPERPSSATVFPQLDRTSISKRLRADLLKAGIDRSALHKATTSGEAIRFHDLRASFITFALLNEHSEAWVTQRTGHTTSQMMYRYKRPHLADLPQKDWTPLDVALGLAAPNQQVDQRREEVAAREAGHAEQLPSQPAVHLPPTPHQVAPSCEIEHGGNGARVEAAGEPTALEQPAQGLDEMPLAGSPGHVDALLDLLVGQGHGAIGDVHDDLQNSGLFGWQHLAADLAVNFCGVDVSLGDPSMFSTGYLGGPKGDRTPDLRIKSSAQTAEKQPKTASEAPTLVKEPVERTEALEAQPELPRSALSDDDLKELTQLALSGERWHLVSKLGADLEAIAQSRATRSNVTQLLVERRKRGAR